MAQAFGFARLPGFASDARADHSGYDTRVRIKGLLFDLGGTLYVGNEPVEGARDAVRDLGGLGVQIRYVTNTTRSPRRQVRERLISMGFDVEDAGIFTPARAAAAVIGEDTCFPLVDGSLLEDLQDIKITDVHPDHVLVGDLGEGFTYERLDAAFRLLMDGAGLIALQKNRYWSSEHGLALDAGPFVAALEYATGKEASVVGKPEGRFFTSAVEDLGLQPGEVAMVGDDAEADVAGARAAGLVGIQVRTGAYRPGTAEEADLTVDSVAALPEALEG